MENPIIRLKKKMAQYHHDHHQAKSSETLKRMWPPKLPIIFLIQVDLRGLHLPFGTMAVAINSEPAEAPWKGEG